MGASAREIEQQIKETRERMDENLGTLETRAATGWHRYGKIAAVAAGVAVSAAVALVVWRKTRRPSLQERLSGFRGRVRRLRRPQLPTVKVSVNEQDEEPGTLESIVRKVAPAVVGTAATGLVGRLTQPPAEEEA